MHGAFSVSRRGWSDGYDDTIGKRTRPSLLAINVAPRHGSKTAEDASATMTIQMVGLTSSHTMHCTSPNETARKQPMDKIAASEQYLCVHNPRECLNRPMLACNSEATIHS